MSRLAAKEETPMRETGARGETQAKKSTRDPQARVTRAAALTRTPYLPLTEGAFSRNLVSLLYSDLHSLVVDHPACSIGFPVSHHHGFLVTFLMSFHVNIPYFVCFDRISAGCLVQPQSEPAAVDVINSFSEIEGRLSLLAKERSRDIEHYLKECRKEESGVMKILLLGGPACGKSTIFKQMRIIHKDGFKRPDQLEYYSGLINRNIHTIFEQLMTGATWLKVDIGELEDLIETIRQMYSELLDERLEFSRITFKLAELLKRFWESAPVQKIYSNRHNIVLLDSAKYYMDRITEIGQKDYSPTESDIVHSREPTETIQHTTFVYNKITLRIIDVGGQKSQRRKWLHLFDDVRVVLFIVDLTLYAKQSDDDDVTTMDKTLKLWKEVATNRILKRALFLLFLNKIDLYEELLKTVPLKTAFKEYEGANTKEDTIGYVRRQFLEAARPRRSVIPHDTTATNTENIKLVFQACMESVFKQSTRATGLTM